MNCRRETTFKPFYSIRALFGFDFFGFVLMHRDLFLRRTSLNPGLSKEHMKLITK